MERISIDKMDLRKHARDSDKLSTVVRLREGNRAPVDWLLAGAASLTPMNANQQPDSWVVRWDLCAWMPVEVRPPLLFSLPLISVEFSRAVNHMHIFHAVIDSDRQVDFRVPAYVYDSMTGIMNYKKESGFSTNSSLFSRVRGCSVQIVMSPAGWEYTE